MDLTTPEGVTAYMSQSTSEDDWNDRGQAVKDANSGYPSFWWETVVKSGLSERVAQSFGGNYGLHVTDLNADGTTTDKGTFDPVTHERLR